jgi:hypothetical protein
LPLAFLAVCSARCPDYDGAAANFAASVNLNTCNALPSSRTHQFLFGSSLAISIEDGALLLPGLLDVCSVRCPVSVFTNLAHGVGFDAPGSAYMFTLRHATSMTRRDPEHLQRALQLHTSF